MHTATLPSQSNYTIEVYDKYIDSNDNAKSVVISGELLFEEKSSYKMVPSTSINWKKQRYREYRLSDGPVRFILNENMPIFYNENNPSNSANILVEHDGIELDSSN